jgi:hypothetical protein
MIRALPFLLAFTAIAAQAALSESERRLLEQSISAPAAREYGKTQDAAALERIVALGDATLVNEFELGMRVANLRTMPADIEAIVVKGFDDPRVGNALRAFTPRYQSRALFDKHYARIVAAYRNDDPSFNEILRTDQPGVDERVLQMAAKFPQRPYELNPAVAFAAARKYPGALPLLFRSLEASYGNPRIYGGSYVNNPVVRAIVAYPSMEAWKRLIDEVDALARDGKIPAEAQAAVHKEVDVLVADPQKALDERKRRIAYAAYEARRDGLSPNLNAIRPLTDSDPRRHAELYEEWLRKVETIAQDYDDERVAYDVASHYHWLAMHVRFRLREPQRAVALFEKAAQSRHALAQVAVGDTWQFDLNDKSRALAAYRRALAEASKPTQQGAISPYAQAGSIMNEWWRAWLAAEVRYLETGKPFRGAIAEKAIRGFFQVMWGNAGAVTSYFPDVPRAPSAEGAAAAERLAPSRLALMAALAHATLLPEAARILRYLERNDPSGYWSACLLGTALYYGGKGAEGREEVVRSGAVRYLPGLAANGNPEPTLAAARTFMQSRELIVRPQAAAK